MRELDYGKMGMRIRQVRKAKGWSQSELAAKCGISMSFLGHIERGSRIMSMETFAGQEPGEGKRPGCRKAGWEYGRHGRRREGGQLCDVRKNHEVGG